MEHYLRNAWYVAGMIEELADGRLLARTIMDEPIVIFRRGDQFDALEDRCCHRQAPLSIGRVETDGIRCGYHGFLFDGSGACIQIPSQDFVPRSARVRSYPVIAQDSFIWLWMGDPQLADPALVPDFSWLDSPDWVGRSAHYRIKCSYRLLIQNLLDSTHLPFVHGTTIGNPGLVKADVRFQRDENDALVTRWTLDGPQAPSYRKVRPVEGNVDRWQNLHFYPPGNCRFHVGDAPVAAGAASGGNVGGVSWLNLNMVVPETESSCHHFWAVARRGDHRDAGKIDGIFADSIQAFEEDIPVLEAQQSRRRADVSEVHVTADGGANNAMLILDAWIKREQADPSKILPRSALKWDPLDVPLPKKMKRPEEAGVRENVSTER